MKYLLTIIVLVLVVAFPQKASAEASSNLQLQIVPLECSIDTLNSGVNVLHQLSPQDCVPPQVEPVPSSPVEPRGEKIRSKSTEKLLDAFNTGIIPLGYSSAHPVPVHRKARQPADSIQASQSSRPDFVYPVVVLAAVVSLCSVGLVMQYRPRRLK